MLLKQKLQSGAGGLEYSALVNIETLDVDHFGPDCAAPKAADKLLVKVQQGLDARGMVDRAQPILVYDKGRTFTHFVDQEEDKKILRNAIGRDKIKGFVWARIEEGNICFLSKGPFKNW